MARTLRIDAAGAWHHVMNRGARKGAIFFDDEDRHTFCRILRAAIELSDVQVHSHVLMGNHYHLLVHTPSGGLGDFMRFVGQHYTQRFNRRHGFDGALFRGRYKSKLIDTDEYLLTTSRYIHRNPEEVTPGIDPAEYSWSSLGAYVGSAPTPSWLSTRYILDMVGGRPGYATFMRAVDPKAA